MPSRRIHISRATRDCLQGLFKTEDGCGCDRSEFLRKHKIDTFLICPLEEVNDHVSPPKTQRIIRTWNPDFPTHCNTIDMNCVSGLGSTLCHPVYLWQREFLSLQWLIKVEILFDDSLITKNIYILNFQKCIWCV